MKLSIITLSFLTVAFFMASNMNASNKSTTCEEVYIELLRAVEEGYINGQQADDIYKGCLALDTKAV